MLMRAFWKSAAVAASAGLGVALLSAPAFAAGGSNPSDLPGGGGTPCTTGDGSDCLYYSAGGAGARAEIFGNVNCFDNCGTYQWLFSDNTVGSAGYNDPVRNATHYVFNNNDTTSVTIYVSPNYNGSYYWYSPVGGEDPYQPNYWEEGWYANLPSPVVNNDASQEWNNPCPGC